MDKTFSPTDHEEKLYAFWEENGYLTAPDTKAEPFTILMPPPNANASLHAGHGMYTVDDILIRWKRIRGFASLWIPGMDHAGFETQYVYEKHLAKDGKSRLDFDRKTLYDNIFTFVKENSGQIYTQFKRLGFLADWKRSVFTLDDHVTERVFQTFIKMVDDNLIYRDEYIVNYCTHCGTTLADLETVYVTRQDPLYYIKYGPFTLATVRPETKFGDTAVAVNPEDTRYKKWIGKEIEVEGLLGTFTLKVIGDEFVDPEFGTGVVKVTPAHDPNDFEMGRRHGLEVKQIIDLDGRLTSLAGPYAGMKVKAAREKVSRDLQEKGLIDRIDQEYEHSVTTCYKCGRDVEPMIFPNWFVRVQDLKEKVMEVVKDDKVSFYPPKFKKQMMDWLEVMHDWPISRQIVWGIRIPVWYEVSEESDTIYVWWLDDNKKLKTGTVGSFLKEGIALESIEKGLQKVMAKTNPQAPYVISKERPEGMYLPETDTFDTWFSSGQWPLVTMQESEMLHRFPTNFMGTLSDILKFWISRMIMFSLYLRQEVPFKDVYLWSLVADAKGQKMSKSKGNVINPMTFIEKYGADAFRATLFFGIAQGGKVNLSEDKVRAMRNFANKIWNVGRFIQACKPEQLQVVGIKVKSKEKEIIDAMEKEIAEVQKKVIQDMDAYKLSSVFDLLYETLWHRIADYYVEELKDSIRSGNIEAWEKLKKAYDTTLVLLHPFMPFVTEAVWKEFHGEKASILDERIV